MTDLQLLLDQEWPPLLAQKLDISDADDPEELHIDLHALADAQWPKLAVLDLSFLYLKGDAIHHLSCAHLPSLTSIDLAGNLLHGDAIKELVKISWPRLEMLDLSYQSSDFGFKEASYLVKGEWPLLKTLDVCGNNVCIGQLLSGNWPALEHLMVLGLPHDDDAPTSVKETSGLAWPSLKRLYLSDGAVDDLAVAELLLAEWPCLEFVCLGRVSAEKVAQILASCKWPALSQLELRHIATAEGAALCTRLSEAHLPVLETLAFYACLDAAALTELVDAARETLKHMTFFCCPMAMGNPCVAQLVQAHCSNLHVLNISCCTLNLEAVSELSRGQWPLLHSLVVCETPLFFWPRDSVKRLLDGRWPVLSKLVLSPSDCEAAAFLLSGSPELLDNEHDSDYQFYPLNKVRKTVTGRGPSQWPCLKFSAFVFPA